MEVNPAGGGESPNILTRWDSTWTRPPQILTHRFGFEIHLFHHMKLTCNIHFSPFTTIFLLQTHSLIEANVDRGKRLVLKPIIMKFHRTDPSRKLALTAYVSTTAVVFLNAWYGLTT